MSDLRSMPLGDLVFNSVTMRIAAPYVDEIRRRLETTTIRQELNKLSHGPSSDWRDERPPQNAHLGPVARAMLDSGWDFSGLRDKSPSQVREFVEGIETSNVMESMLSGGQLGYWRAIVGRYRAWAGLTSPAFQS
jgi:hypothetical protein